MKREEAECFYEDDEDPQAILAAFETGPKFLTAPPAFTWGESLGYCVDEPETLGLFTLPLLGSEWRLAGELELPHQAALLLAAMIEDLASVYPQQEVYIVEVKDGQDWARCGSVRYTAEDARYKANRLRTTNPDRTYRVVVQTTQWTVLDEGD